MTTYRLVPNKGAPVLRHAASIKGATARGLREFPAGLRSVEVVGLSELGILAASGTPIPAAARQRLEVRKAVEREKAKADARVEAIREKEREKLRAKREEERTQAAALKAQEKAERAAEKKRKKMAERRAQRKAAKAAALQAPAALVVDVNDTRLPWED